MTGPMQFIARPAVDRPVSKESARPPAQDKVREVDKRVRWCEETLPQTLEEKGGQVEAVA